MIAIIPARGGSKGLPGKNTRLMNGKPLIAYTIEAAKEAKCIDRVIVSTDSDEIAKVAREYGAEVPFMRPCELAGDNASAIDVYIHAIDFLNCEKEEKIKKFMVLLPTAPLRKAEHICEAFDFFYENKASTLISIKEADTPVTWYMNKYENGHIVNAGFGVGDAVSNRQVNSKYYVPNGAIYILDYMLLKEKRTYYDDKTIGFEMAVEDSVDIDTLLEFKFAEMLIKERQQPNI